MVTDKECDRKGKWFRGCKFEARYTLMPSKLIAGDIKTTVSGALQMAEKHREKRYICDICVRCGKLALVDGHIFRPTKNPDDWTGVIVK